MNQCIVIPPTGDPSGDSRDKWIVAAEVLPDHLTVVTLRAPLLEDFGTCVGFIDDFGALPGDRQLNARAWALYGGSPIFGTMVVARDDDQPLPDTLVTVLTARWDTWTPEHAATAMRTMAGDLGVEL